MGLNQTISSALAPVTKEIVQHKVKQKDFENKTEALKLENDFITITNPPKEIAKSLKTSCYDCHSYETKYPWYTNISPLAWWIKDHINEGRDELNFSEWATYKEKRRNHKIEECIELVDEDEMPLSSYLLTHSEAKLTSDNKMLLLNWFKAQKTK